MYIVWGSGGDVVKAGQPQVADCPICRQQTPFSFWLIYRYFHLYYLFGVVTSRQYRIECDRCRNGMDVPHDRVPDEVKSTAAVPFMRRWGMLVGAGLVGLCFLIPLIAMVVDDLQHPRRAMAQAPRQFVQPPQPVPQDQPPFGARQPDRVNKPAAMPVRAEKPKAAQQRNNEPRAGQPRNEPRTEPGNETQVFGGNGAKPFRDMAPAGGVLIGFEFGLGDFFGNDVIHAARPVFRVGDKEVLGEQHGGDFDRVVDVKAKPGYAVGAITVKVGAGTDGMLVRFMRVIDSQRLDSNDTYESIWIGGFGGGGPSELSGGGRPVIGLIGREADHCEAFGLAFLPVADGWVPEPRDVPLDESKKPADAGVTRRVPNLARAKRDGRIKDQTELIGGGGKQFSDLAPPGGLLVGFEVGLGKFFDKDVVHAVRPVFRVGDQEVPGNLHGSDFERIVDIKARPGYAVGAITVKAGMGPDGFLVTYMKIVDQEHLDPDDSYQSIWIGGFGGGGPREVSGGGRPVIGLIGREKDHCEAMGLALLPVANGIVPPPRNVHVDESQKPADAGVTRTVRNTTKERREAKTADETEIVGFSFGKQFRDAAPPGGLLVGLEVGLGTFVNRDTVFGVRPIYRVGNREVPGQQYGGNFDRVADLKAKPGYAVGAITMKTSLGPDGVMLTYMKIVDELHLDPDNTYESVWVGSFAGGKPQFVSGGGRPVIGLTGRADDRCKALGLALLPKVDGIVPKPKAVEVDEGKCPADGGVTRRVPKVKAKK